MSNAEALSTAAAVALVGVVELEPFVEAFTHKIEFVDEQAPEDIVFEQHGVRLMVDPKSLAYIDGTELDYVREGLQEGFKFNNPNERDRCGCGESFRV